MFQDVPMKLLRQFFVWFIFFNAQHILWNSMTSTSFVFTEGSYVTLFSPSDVTAFHRMKYGGGVLYNLVFTEWRHCVSQNCWKHNIIAHKLSGCEFQ